MIPRFVILLHACCPVLDTAIAGKVQQDLATGASGEHIRLRESLLAWRGVQPTHNTHGVKMSFQTLPYNQCGISMQAFYLIPCHISVSHKWMNSHRHQHEAWALSSLLLRCYSAVRECHGMMGPALQPHAVCTPARLKRTLTPSHRTAWSGITLCAMAI